MSAPVTEAHRTLAVELILGLPSRSYESATVHGAAQLIADSEARACDQLRAERDSMKQEIEMVEHRAYRAEAEVSKLTDALDMMRDEFMRIIACPGCNAEIEDLADRAQLKLVQHVPVITQRDRAEAELAAERVRLDWLAESWDNPLAIHLHPSYGWSAASKNLRAVIDASMKEGTK